MIKITKVGEESQALPETSLKQLHCLDYNFVQSDITDSKSNGATHSIDDLFLLPL